MKILDNISSLVKDDLRQTIKRGSRVSIAAACFSMYAFEELKKQLEQVDEFRFIFTSPTFIKERAEKQKREFTSPVSAVRAACTVLSLRLNCVMK